MSAEQADRTVTVMLYSDDRTTREQMRLALGKRVAADVPAITTVETATAPALLKAVRAGGIDLVIVDGEAVPLGGMGAAHQLKDEIANCPPVLLLIAREADAWLASWSRADAVAAYPIDPVRLPGHVAAILRQHLATQPTPASSAR